MDDHRQPPRPVLKRVRDQLRRRGGAAFRRWAMPRRKVSVDAVIDAAHDLVRSRRYCIVVTTNEAGRPTARTVQPWRPDGDWVIRFGTDAGSRKVAEIGHTGHCLLVYADEQRNRTVSIDCRAEIVTELRQRRRWFMPTWTAFWPSGADAPGFVVVECHPETMELWDGRAVVAPDPFGLASRRVVRGTDGWDEPPS